MIDIKELRIGNWFNTAQGWQIVDCIDSALDLINNKYDSDSEEFEPIDLTSKILIRLGFVQEGSHFIKNLGALKLELYNHTKWYGNFGGIYLGDRLQYVHELQNFYYSWLKRELPIDNLLNSK